MATKHRLTGARRPRPLKASPLLPRSATAMIQALFENVYAVKNSSIQNNALITTRSVLRIRTIKQTAKHEYIYLISVA